MVHKRTSGHPHHIKDTMPTQKLLLSSQITCLIWNKATICHLAILQELSARQRGVHCHTVEQVDARRMPNLRRLHPPPYPHPPRRKEGRSLAGEKATREHSNHRKKQNISKQINKAMTKQYIYIYRYKKKNENCAMIPVSSLHKNVHISIII